MAAIGFSLAAYFVVSSLGHLRPDRVIESPWIDLGSHLFSFRIFLPAYSDGLFNPAFWTLALEEQLYAMFAILLGPVQDGYSIFAVLAIALCRAGDMAIGDYMDGISAGSKRRPPLTRN